jgi:hypothetical protein
MFFTGIQIYMNLSTKYVYFKTVAQEFFAKFVVIGIKVQSSKSSSVE